MTSTLSQPAVMRILAMKRHLGDAIEAEAKRLAELDNRKIATDDDVMEAARIIAESEPTWMEGGKRDKVMG